PPLFRSTSANSSTGTALSAPASPVVAAATNVTNETFTASWNSVVGAVSYRLDVSTVSNFTTFIPGYLGAVVTGTSTDVVGLSGNTTYYYRVRAANSEGTQSISSNTISKLILPDPPAGLPPTAATSNGFTANWTALSGVTSYRLDASTDSEFATFVTGYNHLTVTGTNKLVSGLTEFKTYYYRVRATNATGSSPSSNTVVGASLDNNYVKTVEVSKRGILNQTQLDY